MLSILRKARLKDKELRILMLGLDNAGKTTIVKKIMGEDVNTVSPTLGFIIKTIDYEGYKLNIWDVGGQKTLRSYWRNYFEKTDALIWVVDATDRQRIDDCRVELAGLLQEERLSGASLMVFANKTDVNGCMERGGIVQVCLLLMPGNCDNCVQWVALDFHVWCLGSRDSRVGQALASFDGADTRLFLTHPPQALQLDEIRTHQWNLLECSAMTGQNLDKGLAWVVEDAKARLFLY
ncbi:hypothetical protein RB601_001758 [Gaeumannomyces tritici]